MIVVEAHRVIGIDIRERPDGTPLEAHGYDDNPGFWTAVSIRVADDQRGIGETIGTTIPGGFIEIYVKEDQRDGSSKAPSSGTAPSELR